MGQCRSPRSCEQSELKREKATIAQDFNDVEYNDDEKAPRAPANENETANKHVFESKDPAELPTSLLPERKRPRSSRNEDSLCSRVGKMFLIYSLDKESKKTL